MASDPRESLLLREELHDIYRDAIAGRPIHVSRHKSAFERSVKVDNGVACVSLVRQGVETDVMTEMARMRDAARKRQERREAKGVRAR